MSASNLPDDILILILRPLLSSSIRNVLEETEYLAVCQRWRQIAVPLYYRTMHFTSGRAVDTGVANSCLKEGQLEEPKSWKPETNTEMIVDMGCIGLVKQLNLHINCLANPANGLKMAARFLAQFATVWPNITTLHISAQSYLNHPNPPEGYTELAYQQIHDAASIFAFHFPNIKCLAFKYLQPQIFMHQTLTELVDAFSDKIEQAKFGHGLVTSSSNMLTSLKRFELNSQLYQGHLPLIQPKTLQSLHMNQEFSSLWKGTFVEDPDSSNIAFTNLTDLNWMNYMSFMNNVDDNLPFSKLQSRRIAFPTLQNLHLDLDSEDWKYLNYIMFPDIIEHFTIKTRIDSLQALARVNLPKAKYFSLKFVNGWDIDIDNVVLVNPILSKMSESRYIHLDLDLNALMKADYIQFPRLNQLVLHSPFEISELFKLIDKQPCLEILKIFSKKEVGLAAVPVDELNTDNIRPFKSSIKLLVFKYQLTRYSDDYAADALMYLMARLPNLQKVVSNILVKGKVEHFINSSLDKYPHLTNIALDFD